jgi:hypothetical protein
MEPIMSEHPMNLSSIYRHLALERLNDDELRSTMMEASAILRQRERKRSDDFRKEVRRVWDRFLTNGRNESRP